MTTFTVLCASCMAGKQGATAAPPLSSGKQSKGSAIPRLTAAALRQMPAASSDRHTLVILQKHVQDVVHVIIALRLLFDLAAACAADILPAELMACLLLLPSAAAKKHVRHRLLLGVHVGICAAVDAVTPYQVAAVHARVCAGCSTNESVLQPSTVCGISNLSTQGKKAQPFRNCALHI